MNDTKLDSPEAIKAFLGGTNKLEFQVLKATRYSFLAGTLKRTNYFKLSKKDKGPVREYMERMTGYSWSQPYESPHFLFVQNIPSLRAFIQNLENVPNYLQRHCERSEATLKVRGTAPNVYYGLMSI